MLKWEGDINLEDKDNCRRTPFLDEDVRAFVEKKKDSGLVENLSGRR